MLRRAIRYIQLGKSLQERWILLTFHPPLLLWPILDSKDLKLYNQEVEDSQWKEIEETQGFYEDPLVQATRETKVTDLIIETFEEHVNA